MKLLNYKFSYMKIEVCRILEFLFLINILNEKKAERKNKIVINEETF